MPHSTKEPKATVQSRQLALRSQAALPQAWSWRRAADFPPRANANSRAGAWVIAMMSLEQILQVNAARKQPAKLEKLIVDIPPKVKVPRIHPVAGMTDHLRLRSLPIAAPD